MKLFKTPPQEVVRVEIIERGKESKTITLDERDSVYVSNNIKEMLNRRVLTNINPFEKQKPVSIQCYSCISNKKGKFSTFTVYSLSVGQIYDIIMDNLEK